MSEPTKTILVIGGAGYVGSVLVPKLLAANHRVRVLDLYLFGREVLSPFRSERLKEIRGDMRDRALMAQAMQGVEAVINLACISNDPGFALNPELSKSINYDALHGVIAAARAAGIERFIHASTASVYGIQEKESATEDIPFEQFVPVSDYNRYKALAEQLLQKDLAPYLPTVIIRPSTVCGYSPRLRLDLSVNILTAQAITKRRITVFGGSQKRPNIHIDDITDLYARLAEEPVERIAGKTWNVGNENLTISQIAEIVRSVVGEDVVIETQPSNDPRSYHINSDRIRQDLGFRPQKTVADAVRELVAAFADDRITDPGDPRYVNVATLKVSDIPTNFPG